MTKKKKNLSIIPLFEAEFGTGMQSQGRQDPRTVTLKRQLVSLIDATNFDDNQSVDTLRTGLNNILNNL